MKNFLIERLAEHRPAARGFLLRLVGDDTLADDLTQETFVKAQRGAAFFKGEAAGRSWLCAIALNLVRDHFRAKGRTPEIETDEVLETVPAKDDDAEKTLLKEEMSACIGEFLFKLPSPQRDVLALHDMAGLSHAEIAAQLELSKSNSRVMLHRGRAALRQLMKEGCVLNFDGDAVPCERRPPK